MLHPDDPVYLGDYMSINWLAILNALDLSAVDTHTLAYNSSEALFLPEQDKALRFAKVNDHWRATR